MKTKSKRTDFWVQHGFKPLRSGRMHVRCPGCGRKLSNMPRADYDPKKAVLISVPCDRCGLGCKIEGGDYFDAKGNPVDWHEEFVKEQRREERLKRKS